MEKKSEVDFSAVRDDHVTLAYANLCQLKSYFNYTQKVWQHIFII